MFKLLRPAFVFVVLLTLVTGVAYPLAVTGIAQAVMPDQANGTLVKRGETIIGSSLSGQNFTSERYFWPRPSATSPKCPGANSPIILAARCRNRW